MKDTEENQRGFIVKTPWTRKKIIICAVSIIVILIAAWAAYEFYYLPRKEIPLLQPPEGPTKIRPERTDSMLVPNIDKTVYDALKPGNDTARPVSMMPEPEQPIEVIQPNQKDAIEDIIGKVLSDSEVIEPDKPTDISPAAQTLEQPQEEPVKTLKIIPVETNEPKIQQPKLQKAKPYYKAQLVSVRTQTIAQKEWERLKKLHSKLLGNLPSLVQKIDVKSHGVFYRLLVGKFPSASGAKALCKKLASAQQNCIVVKD